VYDRLSLALLPLDSKEIQQSIRLVLEGRERMRRALGFLPRRVVVRSGNHNTTYDCRMNMRVADNYHLTIRPERSRSLHLYVLPDQRELGKNTTVTRVTV
jgi:hypothetical protein